jgi:hypothetical protein
MPQNLLQGFGQFRAGGVQLFAMDDGEIVQGSPSRGRQIHQHLTPVRFTRYARDYPAQFHSLYQLHRAVVLNKHTGCKFTNGRPHAFRKAMHGEQQLVLLRLEPMGPGCGFAEMEKPADLPAKLGQITILVESQIFLHDLYRITI